MNLCRNRTDAYLLECVNRFGGRPKCLVVSTLTALFLLLLSGLIIDPVHISARTALRIVAISQISIVYVSRLKPGEITTHDENITSRPQFSVQSNSMNERELACLQNHDHNTSLSIELYNSFVTPYASTLVYRHGMALNMLGVIGAASLVEVGYAFSLGAVVFYGLVFRWSSHILIRSLEVMPGRLIVTKRWCWQNRFEVVEEISLVSVGAHCDFDIGVIFVLAPGWENISDRIHMIGLGAVRDPISLWRHLLKCVIIKEQKDICSAENPGIGTEK